MPPSHSHSLIRGHVPTRFRRLPGDVKTECRMRTLQHRAASDESFVLPWWRRWFGLEKLAIIAMCILRQTTTPAKVKKLGRLHVRESRSSCLLRGMSHGYRCISMCQCTILSGVCVCRVWEHGPFQLQGILLSHTSNAWLFGAGSSCQSLVVLVTRSSWLSTDAGGARRSS